MCKPVRMADIAEKLNISVVSVSKGLSNKPGVSEDMRARIVAAAQEMGYVGTRPQRANEKIIGVLAADRFFSGNSFYISLFRALLSESEKDQMICMMEVVSKEAECRKLPPNLVRRRKCDGIIFLGDFSGEYIQAVADPAVPCLLLDFNILGCRWDSVTSDNVEGGYALTRHLLSTGRRDIGFAGSISSTYSIMSRYLGYQRALREAGIVPREEWLLEDRDSGGRLVPVILPDMMPQAFLCSCDETAYHLIHTLKTNGFRVPEDIAVCGYDNVHFAELCAPPLTTYQVDVEAMAQAAWRLIGRMVCGKSEKPMQYVVYGQLVTGQSTEPPTVLRRALSR